MSDSSNLSQAPLTVLYLHSSDDLYGADIILLNIVTGLDRARYRPIVVLPDDMRHVALLSPELGAAGIEYVHLPIAILRRRYLSPRGLVGFLRRLVVGTLAVRTFSRERDVKIVHGFTLAVIAAPLVAFVLRRPLIMHAHEILLRPRLLRRIMHWLATVSAEKVICVSDAVRVNILEDRPRATNRVLVLRNGIAAPVATQTAPAELRRELGVPLDKPLVGMIGRISAWKGQEIFVAAASLLRSRDVSAHYVAIGGVFDNEQQHLQRLQRAIDALDIGSSLTLGGFRRNARRFLPAFDLFILPSTSPEPLGVVILEAMAAAIPVIATAHGGSVEMVVDGVTGMLIPPGDPEALAQAIAFLLNDPERCRAMGLAGRERFYKHFSLDQYLRGVEALYASVDKV